MPEKSPFPSTANPAPAAAPAADTQVAEKASPLLAELEARIDWFAAAMKAQLKANLFKGDWRGQPGFDAGAALARLREEVAEVAEALDRNHGSFAALAETADVGNVAMIIADLYLNACGANPAGVLKSLEEQPPKG